jgi:hypothetical protein
MRFLGFLSLIPLVAALAAPARAQLLADGETLDRILPMIRADHPGRLSDAEPWTDELGRTHYRIKWMTPEGRIIYFDADARSGRYSNWSGAPRVQRDRVRGEDNGPPPGEDRGRRRDNYTGDLGNGPGNRDWHDRFGDWRAGRGIGDNGGWHHHEHGGH